MKPTFAVLAVVAIIGIGAGMARRAEAQDFSYKARQDRVIGHRDGQLVFSDQRVQFRTKSEKDSLTLAYEDIRLFEILSPTKIRIWIYEGRSFPPRANVDLTFHIVGRMLGPELRDFVRARIARPVVSEVVKDEGQPQAQIAVEHLHRIGGCSGLLKLYADSLVFESMKGHDSRSWRWTDIQSISKLGPYRIEVLTYEHQTGGPTRSYNFELKQPLPDQTYDLIWARVFRPQLPFKEGTSLADGTNNPKGAR